jgi:ribonuclease BN (tRNA processing enzyme)
MLTLTFLGVGSAFAKRNFNSNALVEVWSKGPQRQEEPDDTLLIDFGGLGPLALHTLKDKPGFGYLKHKSYACYPKIRKIFITHQHADHIGGLEELASMNAYAFPDPESGKPFRPHLLCPRRILERLWAMSLRGGLGVLHGRPAVLEDYFDVCLLESDDLQADSFTLADRYRLDPFATDHIRMEERFDWPSYGLVMVDTRTGESVYYTGDTRCDTEENQHILVEAKLGFHDVQLFDYPNSVHSPISELRKLPPAVKAKMHLFHFGDNWDSPAFDFVNDEFAGFAVPHHRYVLFE